MGRTADLGLAGRWQARLERFRRGGLTVGRFCANEGVSVASFYGWRRKLAAGSAVAGRRRVAGSASFQAVELVAGLPEVVVAIRLREGVTIRVSGSGELVERLYGTALERLAGADPAEPFRPGISQSRTWPRGAGRC